MDEQTLALIAESDTSLRLVKFTDLMLAKEAIPYYTNMERYQLDMKCWFMRGAQLMQKNIVAYSHFNRVATPEEEEQELPAFVAWFLDQPNPDDARYKIMSASEMAE